MKIRILGSAAGGGFPQWNCNCFNCSGVRNGSIQAFTRTQSSIAVSENSRDWVLINASPDILSQIRATPALQPARAVRDSGVCAVVLMDAQIDHVAGLLMLRERTSPLPIYATRQVLEDLSTGLPLMHVLSHYCGVDPREIAVDEPFGIDSFGQTTFTAIALSSKAPPYSPHRDDPVPGDNIGLQLFDWNSGKTCFYAPGLGHVDPPVLAAMKRADVLLVDGTFWTDDEMITLGLSNKRAADMGHLPQFGPGGMLEVLNDMPGRRKILTHINNSNPILREDSLERALLTRHGVEIASDGLEIEL